MNESAVSSSTNDIAVESLHSQPKGNKVEKNDAINKQNKTALATDVEGNHKSIIMTVEVAESKVHLLDHDEDDPLSNDAIAEVKRSLLEAEESNLLLHITLNVSEFNSTA
ncbi:hypothetical protein NE237_017955 [Protea cynaroides]|uniref:Uncharacterized protein n=1 Tax=Protea cynaroides TaxID=273540 RepID=A0A9Q0K947_9MAGN|nr:hypothetical protein NE237_017955 [Protea cynaroides]